MNWRVAEVVNVVPLMAMIRARAAAGSDVDTRLLFSSRNWEDVIYREELERLGGDGLTVVHTLTRSQPPGWTGYARRVDAELLAKVGPSRTVSRPSASDRREGERWTL
jgi:ferredoxin-NADP reductase